ncbi:MAG TPA: DUF6064 family protein [Ideonella sp.]|nr:DUF6064 family protein [Ideonella sp.]
MSEWWTYRPSDFLMFAPRTYWRLFEQQNEAWWPAQPLLLLAGLGWLLWLTRRGSPSLRTGAAGLAAASAFVGWAFMLQRYAPVNWAAAGFAAVFFALALALAVAAALGELRVANGRIRRRVGLALLAAGLLAWPLLAPAFGRPWLQAEIFALAPDPTAIATLGFLVLAVPRGRVVRWALRAAWCAALAGSTISVATLWTLGTWQAGFVLAAALAPVAAAWRLPADSRHQLSSFS